MDENDDAEPIQLMYENIDEKVEVEIADELIINLIVIIIDDDEVERFEVDAYDETPDVVVYDVVECDEVELDDEVEYLEDADDESEGLQVILDVIDEMLRVIDDDEEVVEHIVAVPENDEMDVNE